MALLGYLCLSAAIFGRAALADVAHVVVGSGQSPGFYGRDQSAFVWFLAWGAHALAHLENPFVTHAVYAPAGYNLTWAASILGPSLALAPLTAAIGAVPAFDLLAVSAPAASAWAAYMLCRELTLRASSALVGGLLFGFGTYEATETVNHLNLALVALVPLGALVVLRRARGRSSRAGFVLALGATLGAQAWTSTEVLASAIVFGALALAVAYLLAGESGRAAVWALAGEAALASVLAGAIAAPYVWYACTSANPLAGHATVDAGADLANFVVPTPVTLLHGGPLAGAAARLGGNLTEQLAYVGPVLPALVLAFAVECRRRWLARSLASFTALAALLSLGGRLIVAGHETGVRLPWGLIGQLPPLTFGLPGRFALYVWLGGALTVALWLDRPRLRPLRWLAVAAAVATVLPNTVGLPWGTRVDDPPLLSGPALARYVPRGSTVLALPFGSDGNSMYWQVESGFAFRLAGGYVSWALPPAYRGLSILHELTGRPPGGRLARRLCAFLAMTGARTILLREHVPGDWSATLRPLRVAPVRAGGFLVYRLPTRPCTPAAPRPPRAHGRRGAADVRAASRARR